MPAMVYLLVLTLGSVPAPAAASTAGVAPPTAQIDASVAAGRRFLGSLQRADGAIADPANPLFETWETVAAATALFDSDPDRDQPALGHALAYLSAHENPQGLVCHNRRCQDGYCLETTSEYFLLRTRFAGAAKLRPKLTGVVDLQRPSGEWRIGNPDVREQLDFPSVTAFVLTMLDAADKKPRDRARAWAWLLGRQRADGSWGSAWEYYGSPAYGLWAALRALEPRHSAAVRIAREKAVAFIRTHQLADGSWHFVDPQRPKAVSAELETALMLSALRYADTAANRPAIERGIAFLVARQQPDGSWDGGDFPIESEGYQKKEHVFATARAISVLAWWRATAAD